MQEGFEAEDDIGARDDYTREVDEEAAFRKAQVNARTAVVLSQNIALLQ